MRIRSIMPGFWRSDDIDAISIEDRLLFIGLWSYVDDNGVGIDRESSIAADLFAGDLSRDPSETIARVSRGLARLSERNLVVRYEVDGRRFLHVTNFDTHQRVDKPSKPRYPLPPARNPLSEPHSRDSRESLASPRETFPLGEGEKGRRGEGEKVVGDRAKLPLVENSSTPQPAKPTKRAAALPEDWRPSDDVNQALAAECPNVDLEYELRKFRDWAANAKPHKDWTSTWRNWIRRSNEGHYRPGPKTQAALPSRNTQILDSFEQRMINRSDRK